MRRMMQRGLFVVALFVALVSSALITGAGSRASAQEPAFVLHGRIRAVGDTPLPTRLRALVGETVCGSSVVLEDVNGQGSYALAVVSSDVKPECGSRGAQVRIVAVNGNVEADTIGVVVTCEPGTIRELELRVVHATIQGLLPESNDTVAVRWNGPRAQVTVVAEFVRAIVPGRRYVEVTPELPGERWVESSQVVWLRGDIP